MSSSRPGGGPDRLLALDRGRPYGDRRAPRRARVPRGSLAGLLDALRRVEWLREPRPGCFYVKSRAFLHFHEDPTGLFADVRLVPQGDFERRRVSTRAERAALLRAVRDAAPAFA